MSLQLANLSECNADVAEFRLARRPIEAGSNFLLFLLACRLECLELPSE